MALKLGRQVSSANLTVAGSVIPPGSTIPFSGDAVPNGWLYCDGAEYSRTVFAALFSAIGTKYGIGDGVTTFNVPDDQGLIPRCHVRVSNATGSGTVATNNATFTASGINRTGFKIRLLSGTLTGLGTGVTYFAIVIAPNTLAFATTYANALAGTKIAISGTNTGVITQWEDPDQSSRLQTAVGGVSSGGLGTRQDDELRSHTHQLPFYQDNGSGTAGRGNPIHGAGGTNQRLDYIFNTGGNETRMANTTKAYIIKT